MPLNVRRFYTSVLLVFLFSVVSYAQTSADVMRERVAKAKAFIAVKNFNAAIYELENIRRETKEPAVNGVINVLLMNSYLEQGDYKRAQEFLKELANDKKPNASANYLVVAGQVVKGARNQIERYRALGLSVADRNMPLEAITDVEKMRESLELVVEQSKILGKDKAKTSDAMALLEEATNARGSLARDDFDANRWKNEITDAREQLANMRSVVVNAVDGTTTSAVNAVAIQNVAQPNLNTTTAVKPTETNPTFSPVPNSSADNSKTPAVVKNDSTSQTESAVKIENPIQTNAPKEAIKQPVEVSKTDSNNSSAQSVNKNVEAPVSVNKTTPVEAKTETQATTNKIDAPKTDSPLAVGSLIEYVTQKVNPTYPPAARTVRMSGVVKVDVVVDEEGKVTEVQKTSGPQMLQRAATDAIKKWKFKPFVRDGQPTKATGFISFNFNL
jgi:protein TonB